MDYGTHGKSANARVHIGEAPYIQMERNDMEAKIIYGTDTEGRLYTKNQLGGEVLAVYRWKSKQHYVDDKPPVKITPHSHIKDRVYVSSGNSHYLESMPNIAWRSVLPPVEDEPRVTGYFSRTLNYMRTSLIEALEDIDLGPATRAILNDE